MFLNYLTIAFRNLYRNLGYTAISVLGLTVGMASCLLIGLYVGDELNYDDFHATANRIHVIGVENNFFGRGMATQYPLGSILEENLPMVERAVRTVGREGTVVRRPGQSMQAERRLLLADSTFFQVFDFPLVQGRPGAALDAPDAVVITESMARDFFGNDNPIGEALQVVFGDSTYTLTVRGLAEDVPRNSTIEFDMVTSLSLLETAQRNPEVWGWRMFHTYVLLKQPIPPDTLAAQAQRAVNAILGDSDRGAQAFFSIPLTRLYLSDQYNTEGFRGQQRYLYIFGSIALFILLIAAINYVNLVTAQAQQRAREVGVRKSMGGRRGQLARQFLSESLMLIIAALILALGLTALALPVFNASFGTELTLLGEGKGPLLLGLTVTMLLAGIAAGAYPAFVLSGYQPMRVLRGATSTSTGGTGWLRRGLVVLQFAISAAIIVSTVVVYQQLGYMQMKNLGFDKEEVVVVNLPQSSLSVRPATLKEQLLRQAAVENVSMANVMPGHAGVVVGMSTADVSTEANTTEEHFSWVPIHADSSFVETLGLQFVAGRSFDRGNGTNAGVLINESAASELGWSPDEAVGKPFQLEYRGEGVVVGVVRDFHHSSLREDIMPVVITIGGQDDHGLVAVKFAAGDTQEGMNHVQRVLAAVAPDMSLDYQFLDEKFEAMYRSEERLSQIFTAFAGIAIFIACLGLLGLVAYAVQRRTKEIGVRKAMGASLANIISLLSKEFLVLLVVAMVIGMPTAYWAMQRWLEDFAFRTTVGGWTFVFTAVVVLAIAGASVSVHAIRAARIDPADALRSE